MALIPFEPFQKIPRLKRAVSITEKIDGTNASICIGAEGEFLTGSRNRWITVDDDNYGFAKWAQANKEDLLLLGPGNHYGEWWGQGIQRRYDMTEKRFSLFNAGRWAEGVPRPKCCHVVPVLYTGIMMDAAIEEVMEALRTKGSVAAPGFMNPEGIIIYHTASRSLFKKTLDKDEEPKGKAS